MVKIVSIPMDSDAVFHEESEYVVGFKIRVKKLGLSLLFRWKRTLCFLKKIRSAVFVFCLYLWENRVYFKKFYYQNDQRKILYKP